MLLLFELTHDYFIIIPTLGAVGISYWVSSLPMPEDLLTAARRKLAAPHGRLSAIFPAAIIISGQQLPPLEDVADDADALSLGLAEPLPGSRESVAAVAGRSTAGAGGPNAVSASAAAAAAALASSSSRDGESRAAAEISGRESLEFALASAATRDAESRAAGGIPGHEARAEAEAGTLGQSKGSLGWVPEAEVGSGRSAEGGQAGLGFSNGVSNGGVAVANGMEGRGVEVRDSELSEDEQEEAAEAAAMQLPVQCALEDSCVLVPSSASVAEVLELMDSVGGSIALVTDEKGVIRGAVTRASIERKLKALRNGQRPGLLVGDVGFESV